MTEVLVIGAWRVQGPHAPCGTRVIWRARARCEERPSVLLAPVSWPRPHPPRAGGSALNNNGS
jgi:hypothetical protein